MPTTLFISIRPAGRRGYAAVLRDEAMVERARVYGPSPITVGCDAARLAREAKAEALSGH